MVAHEITEVHDLSYSLVVDADDGEAQLTICGAGTQAGYANVVAVSSGVDNFSKIVFNGPVSNADLESKYIEIIREWAQPGPAPLQTLDHEDNDRIILTAVAKHWRT